MTTHFGGDMAFKDRYEAVSAAFQESVIRHLKIEEVRRFITVPVPDHRCHTLQMISGQDSSIAVIQEYSDYLNVTDEDVIERAKILGAGCAILYNALLRNVRFTFGQNVVIDLLENKNLKFSYAVNTEPSVSDPCCVIPGWISFRFHFASSNVSSSLRKGKTLETLEEHAH